VHGPGEELYDGWGAALLGGADGGEDAVGVISGEQKSVGCFGFLWRGRTGRFGELRGFSGRAFYVLRAKENVETCAGRKAYTQNPPTA